MWSSFDRTAKVKLYQSPSTNNNNINQIIRQQTCLIQMMLFKVILHILQVIHLSGQFQSADAFLMEVRRQLLIRQTRILSLYFCSEIIRQSERRFQGCLSLAFYKFLRFDIFFSCLTQSEKLEMTTYYLNCNNQNNLLINNLSIAECHAKRESQRLFISVILIAWIQSVVCSA